eukprot:COSAG04_NODE_18498_length_440_cov_0.756598_1_plen_87_part_10
MTGVTPTQFSEQSEFHRQLLEKFERTQDRLFKDEDLKHLVDKPDVMTVLVNTAEIKEELLKPFWDSWKAKLDEPSKSWDAEAFWTFL